MEIFEWIVLRLLILVLLLTGAVGFIYYATGLIPLIFGMQSFAWILALRLSVTSVIIITLAILSCDYLPEMYEGEEEEFVDELVIHEDEMIFRFSLLGSILLGLIIGTILQLTPIFITGLMIGGSLLITHIVNIVAAVIIDGEESLEDIGESLSSESIWGMLITGLLLVALSVGLSFVFYQGLYQKIDIKQNNAITKKSKWEKIKDTIYNLKKSLEKTIQDRTKSKENLTKIQNLNKQIYAIIKKKEVAELQKWIQHLNNQTPKDEYLIHLIQKVLQEKLKK